MIKTIQLILYSWYLDTIDFIEFIGEHIHQSLCCHQWNDWHEPEISYRLYENERWMERECRLCGKRKERDI